jgi:TPR repeat protein
VAVVAGSIEDADAAYNRGDYSTAINIYRSLAANGNPKAQLNVGLMFVEGQGVAKDLDIAQIFFKSAAANPASDQATRADAIYNQDFIAKRLAK